MASFNTRSATELCIRSLRRTTRTELKFRVGDSASTDGSSEMIRELEQTHQLCAEVVDQPRRHHEWLDSWYGITSADYLVFIDSDMDFRDKGWLEILISTAESRGAALVTGRMKADSSGAGNYTRRAECPEPHLLLLDMRLLRGRVTTSFGWYEEEEPGSGGRKVGYDVGGRFMYELRRQGLIATAIDPEFRSMYRHWGRLSHWRDRHQTALFGAKTQLKRLRIRERLIVERLRDKWSSRGPTA